MKRIPICCAAVVLCACGATAANMTEASCGTPHAAAPRNRGLLLLRFDDRNFAGWEKALPLFEKTGAHATFFINGAIDGRAVATMRKLKAAGHSLAAHGLGHLKVVDSVARMGAREYLEKELRPQLVAAEKAGVPLRHFGYPCSQRDAQSDALLLTRFDRIAGGGFWEEAKEGRIVSCDEMFVPVAEAPRRRVWIGTCIGNFAPTVTGELARVIRRLSERNEATLLYAHDIVSAERPDHHDMSFAALEFLLKAAQAAGVRVCGFDELAFDGFSLSRERLFPGFDGKFCKMQPTVATDWKGTALLTFQRLLLTGSDVFYGQFISKSSDGGRTWGEPKEIGIFKDTHEDGCRVARYANVRYARKSDRWYALGHAQLYADDKVPLHGRVNGRPTGAGIFATVDPVKGELTSYTDLPFPFEYDRVLPYGDPVELDNGELIVPFYYNPRGARTKPGAWSPPGKIVCVQYRFGARGLEVVRAGRPVECPELKRGCGEPSLAKFNGRFYLTVRSDERGMYAESADGLAFGELRTWCWEDGTPIGNRNTQQHWMQLSSGLYLAYTREGALNDHVFRNRAPIFLARFDLQRRCLVRSTELPLVPEYGARLGNFQTISDGAGAAWLVTAEWMQPIGCEKYGSDNALWIVKMETR